MTTMNTFPAVLFSYYIQNWNWLWITPVASIILVLGMGALVRRGGGR